MEIASTESPPIVLQPADADEEKCGSERWLYNTNVNNAPWQSTPSPIDAELVEDIIYASPLVVSNPAENGTNEAKLLRLPLRPDVLQPQCHSSVKFPNDEQQRTCSLIYEKLTPQCESHLLDKLQNKSTPCLRAQ